MRLFVVFLSVVCMSANAALFPGLGFGDGSGGAQIPVVHSSSPFASIAARNTYFTTNPSELLNNNENYTVISITGGSTFRWSGADMPSTYDATDWQDLGASLTAAQIKLMYESNANTNAFTDSDDTAVGSIMNLSPGVVPMSDGSQLATSGITVGVVDGLNRVTIDGELAPRSGGGLRLGQNDIGGGGTIYGGGSALRFKNTVNDTESYPVISLVTEQGSGSAFYPKFQSQRSDPSPANKSQTFTGSPGIRFAFNNPLPGRVTQYTISNPTTETFTGCDFTIWLRGYDDPDPLFHYVDSNPRPVKTFSIPPGDVVVTPPEPIGFPPAGTRIFSEILCSSGNVQLSGQTIPFLVDPTDPDGETENVDFPYIEFVRNFSIQQFLEDYLGSPSQDGQVLSSTTADVRSWITPATDTEHPVTLRRDMPSSSDAADLISESKDGNSAIWVVSANQLLGDNRTGATIRAISSGALDVNGSEIPTTATAANSIQLRAGTHVRIFAANDYRVISSPVLEGDITAEADLPIQDDGVQIVADPALLNFTGSGVTVTGSRGAAIINVPGSSLASDMLNIGPYSRTKTYTRGESFYFDGAIYEIAVDEWDPSEATPEFGDETIDQFLFETSNPTGPLIPITLKDVTELNDIEQALSDGDSGKMIQLSRNLGRVGLTIVDNIMPALNTRLTTAESDIDTAEQEIDLLQESTETRAFDATLRDEVPTSSTAFPEVYISSPTRVYISFTQETSFNGYGFTTDVINKIANGVRLIVHSTLAERRAVFEFTGQFDLETQLSNLINTRYRRYFVSTIENNLTAADVDNRVELVLQSADFSTNFVTRSEYNAHLFRFINVGAREFNFIPSGTSYGSYDGNGWFLATQSGDPSELLLSIKVDKGIPQNLILSNPQTVGSDTIYSAYFGTESGDLEYNIKFRLDSTTDFSSAVRFIGKAVAVTDAAGTDLIASGDFPTAADEPLFLLVANPDESFQSVVQAVAGKQDASYTVMNSDGDTYTVSNGHILGTANPVSLAVTDGTYNGVVFVFSRNAWFNQNGNWVQIQDPRTGPLQTRVNAADIDVTVVDAKGGTSDGVLASSSSRVITVPDMNQWDTVTVYVSNNTTNFSTPIDPIDLSAFTSGFTDVDSVDGTRMIRLGRVSNTELSIINLSSSTATLYIDKIVFTRVSI